MLETATPLETDALVIGAGPVGLFAVFQLGLQGLRVHVVDALPHAGGQCSELYADKPIYDIPGIPACNGQELIDRLMAQIAPFKAVFHLGQQVTSLQRKTDLVSNDACPDFVVGTSAGLQIRAKVVLIAAGVGAFLPRKLAVPQLARFEGNQLHYHGLQSLPAPRIVNQDIVIVGGDEGAIELALDLVLEKARNPSLGDEMGKPSPTSVTLVHRRDTLAGDEKILEKFDQAVAQGHLRFVPGRISNCKLTANRLSHLQLTRPDGTELEMPVDTLFVQLGLSPQLGALRDWGLSMQRKQLSVDTESFSTSERGVFAVGDINDYAGKRKLIVCGFHEATLAAFGAAALIRPDESIQLQYTTTSPRLQQRLGLDPTNGK